MLHLFEDTKDNQKNQRRTDNVMPKKKDKRTNNNLQNTAQKPEN